MSKRFLPILVFAAFVLSVFVIASNTSFGPTVPTEAVKYSSDWPSANQNYSNTRAAVNSSIESSSIGKLTPAWGFPIKSVSEWGSAATNPVILGNVLYFQDLKSNVYAVDMITGKQIWEKEYNLDVEGPSGVAVGYGKIFATKGRYQVVGLDMNGNEIWSTTLSNNQNVGIDIQPTVYGNMVFVSTVPGVSNENFYKGGSVGVIYALNEKTGKVDWSFDTVDTKDIWGNAAVNSGGGAWYPPAIDTTSGLLYWGIGNPAPWPGTKEFPNGSSRPGDNLYTNSVVALNRKNGVLSWFNQVKPHDLFDYDLQISPILSGDMVIGGGKMGKVVAFDKKTGKKLWETKVGTHLNDELTTLPAGITNVSPGPLGGIETPMAYSDGVIYAANVDMTVQYTPSEFVANSFNLSNGKGGLTAIDATSGKVLWTQKFNSLNVGGATVVNDLVFTTTFNGKIYAFDKKTGAKVWEYQAPGGINGWPAVRGDTIVFPVGLGKTPMLLAFKIGGSATINGVAPQPAGGSGKGFQQ